MDRNTAIKKLGDLTAAIIKGEWTPQFDKKTGKLDDTTKMNLDLARSLLARSKGLPAGQLPSMEETLAYLGINP